MKILFNAVSAKMGGAANYIKNVVRELARRNTADEYIFLLPDKQASVIRGVAPHIHTISTEAGSRSLQRRMWYDQVTVRRMLRRERVDVLFSTANFGMFGCPCRQLLLIRNPLYFFDDYLTRILPRQKLRMRMEVRLRRWLACRSMETADLVISPTSAMLKEAFRFVRVPEEKVLVNHYGVDEQRFRPLPAARAPHFENGRRVFRLLFSSLYGEHKNIDTLLRALTVLRDSEFDWRLITPADPNREDVRWTCTWREDARLAADPRIAGRIRFLAQLRSEQMAELYQEADVFVYPSAVESFGHPLVEALCSGMPIVAADTPVNHELAGDAAVYFSRFDAEDFARQLARVLGDEQLRNQLSERASQQSRRFSWSKHVDALMDAFASTAPRTMGNRS
jgi:glycosyltransferase involved in cell wall biosynthesis